MSTKHEQQFHLAEQQLMQGKVQQALALFLPLKAHLTHSAQYFKAVATCYFGLKEYQLAVESFEQAYQLANQDLQILSGYGTALYQNKQIQAAVDKFCAALAIEPRSVDTRIKLIALLKECQQMDQALTVLREGLSYTPNNTILTQLQVELTGVAPQPSNQPSNAKLSANEQLESLWQNRQLGQLVDIAIKKLNGDITTEEADQYIVYLQQITNLHPSW